MAVIANTADRNTAAGMALFTWTPLTTGDTGAPITTGYSADLTIQVFGTFGGATVTFQGSNDGTK